MFGEGGKVFNKTYVVRTNLSLFRLLMLDDYAKCNPDERRSSHPQVGDLGRKTGKGFYHWGEGDKRGEAAE